MSINQQIAEQIISYHQEELNLLSSLSKIASDDQAEIVAQLWAKICIRNLNYIIKIIMEHSWLCAKNMDEEIDITSDIIEFASFMMICHGSSDITTIGKLYHQDSDLQQEFTSDRALVNNIIAQQKQGLSIMKSANVKQEMVIFLSERIDDSEEDTEEFLSLSHISKDNVRDTVIKSVEHDKSNDHLLDKDMPLINHISQHIIDYVKGTYNPLNKHHKLEKALEGKKFKLKDVKLESKFKHILKERDPHKKQPSPKTR